MRIETKKQAVSAVTTSEHDLKTLSTPEYRGKRVKYIRAELLNLNRVDFCKESNISLTALKSWELVWGGGLTEHGAEKFCAYVKSLGVICSPTWLIHGIGEPPSKDQHQKSTTEEDAQIAEEILLFGKNQNSINTIMEDDSMCPIILLGDFVGGVFVTDFEDGIGKPCIIFDTNQKMYIRILEHGDETSLFNLLSFNKNTNEAQKILNIKISKIAPILWVRRRLKKINQK